MPKEMYAVLPSYQKYDYLPLMVMSFETYDEALAHMNYTIEKIKPTTFTLSIRKCTIHDGDCHD